MNIVNNYSYYENGFLKTLSLFSSQNTSDKSDITYVYDASNRLSTVTVSNGSVLKFEYNAHGNISTVKLNDVVIYSYEYDMYDRIIKQKYGTSSDYYTFCYNSTDNLISTVHYVKNNVSVLKYSYEYDIIGRLKKVTDSAGAILRQYTYGNDNEIIKAETADSSI